ncbi:DUF771 domain-containing protein [Niallia endozanthoxylica]|uniref:DUF771 domain-containing protein n=1 Tax=Niallia endozanthoxylica TaxID=2036016 RepID=A0A5J5HRX3_9BACI|nr:DUF771 domain-containing protein [Niallia endozanthoxylica]KAA9023577.1 DUF771 domain-containing protein [Niallia endozanthoxylica]
MQQRLSVNLTIPISSDSVLISRTELEELQQSKYDGFYWTMKDVEKKVGKKSEWIKERILYPPNFRKKLDVKYGGPVAYPKSKGEAWTFHAKKNDKILILKRIRLISIDNGVTRKKADLVR